MSVDISENDEYVAIRAQKIAKQYQSKLRIVHVLDNIPMPDTNNAAE